MRIAVLPPFSDDIASSIENFFLIQSLRTLLADYDLHRLSEASDEKFDLYLCIGDRFLADGFWDRWILGQPEKTSVIALSVDSTRVWDSRSMEKLRSIGRQGGVSVTDEASLKKVKEVLVSSEVSLGGSPVLFSSADPLLLVQSGRVFCPKISDPAFSGRSAVMLKRLLRRFYARMNHQGRALFMVHNPEEFECGALTGFPTLFEPNHPQMHLKAIASASSVVGFHPSSLMAAIACGVPGVLIGTDRKSRNAAESAGIPFLEINPNTDPAELGHRADEIVRKYPWETVKEKSGRLREGLVEHLKRLGLKPRETKRRQSKVAQNVDEKAVLHVATIVDQNSFPSFLGFFENLSETSDREVHFHALALDRSTELLLQKTFTGHSVYLYRPSEIWEDSELSPLMAPAFQRRFLLKPRFLSMLLQKAQAPVLYCESSLFFYRAAAELIAALDGGNALFFPRWSDRLPSIDSVPLFDTSVLVIAPGSEELLAWWFQTAITSLASAPSASLKNEMGAIAFAPILFPGVRVYRAADQNIGRETFVSLGVQSGKWDGDPLRLADGRSIRSLRCEGSDRWGYFGAKIVWDQISFFFSPLATSISARRLENGVLTQQTAHWKQLRRFLQVHRLFSTHFPWFAHRASASERRFFVSGAARWLTRLWTESPSISYEIADPAWSSELQNRVFAPYRTGHSVPPKAPLAASA